MSTSVFAPARVDLSPGFTDVEPLCVARPGRVVNVALDVGVTVTVQARDDVPAGSFVDRLRAAVARRLGVDPPGLLVETPSLPPGSGLGASGALSVALAQALSQRAGARVDLVALACAAERDAGLTGGTQDQLASVHGGVGLVRRHGNVGDRVPVDTRLDLLAERLVLVHGTGSRNSGAIIEQVLARPRDAVLRVVERMNLVGERLADGLRAVDFDRVAELVAESTALLRDLHPDIVVGGVEGRLRELGARAAKPCGAGGPGAVWATLVEPDARAAYVDAVTEAGWSVLAAAPSARGVRLA